MGTNHRSPEELSREKEQRKRVTFFLLSLLVAAFVSHGFFLALSGTLLLSWRLAANGLVIFFLAFFSYRCFLTTFRSVFSWVGLWFIFLGEALFLLEYPALFVVQEGLHGVLLLGGSFLVILGLWQEKKQSFHPGMEEFLEQISKPALFLDKEGRIQGINGKGTSLLGYALSDLKGHPFVQFLPSAIREKSWDRFWKIQEGRNREASFWLTTKEGKEMFVRVTPLFPTPGSKTGIVFELEDATRNRVNWLSFYREGRRLRNYLEAVQDIFLILDEEGRAQYINQAGSTLLGLKRKDILGKTLECFIKDEERVRGELIFRALQEGKPIPENERIIKVLTARGEVRQIRWNYRIISNPTGTIEGFALSGIDVTQEVSHWEELQADHLFQWTLLDLIHRALAGKSVVSVAFWQGVVASFKAVFATEEAWYLERVDDESFAVVGDEKGGREGQRILLSGRGLEENGVFVTGLQWEGHTLVLSSQPGLPPFLVVPLWVSGKLAGLFLFGGREKPFTGVDVQWAQILQETLELLLYRGQTEAELLYLSSHDPLTGALNHKAFREKGEEILALAERYGRPFSLIFLDVDDFKSINDRFGHLFGDRMLSFFAQHLRANLRRNDLLARFGGDEFVLLLPETPGTKARELLERLQHNPLFLEEGEEAILLRFSAGVSVYPEDGKTLEALMEMADLRMYERKKAGNEKT